MNRFFFMTIISDYKSLNTNYVQTNDITSQSYMYARLQCDMLAFTSYQILLHVHCMGLFFYPAN